MKGFERSEELKNVTASKARCRPKAGPPPRRQQLLATEPPLGGANSYDAGATRTVMALGLVQGA